MESLRLDELLYKYRYPAVLFLSGLIVIGLGVIYLKGGVDVGQTKIEVLNSPKESQVNGLITADIAGQVINPGVYKLKSDSRVDDLLVASGGFTADADRAWTDKNLNRAAKLNDGQKLYIPSVNEHSDVLGAKNSGGYQSISTTNLSDSNTIVNINTASLGELDALPGIGQTYGQSIIEHRPYSNTEELLSKGVLKKSVYEKLKNRVSAY